MSMFEETYEIAEKPSKYAKFQDGDNVFRFLGQVVTGWEYWTDKPEGGRMPNRVKTWEDLPEYYKRTDVYDSDEGPKEFHAYKVLNRNEYDKVNFNQVQILEITQLAPMKTIKRYDGDKKRGPITGYDINIYRERTGPKPMNVKYTVEAYPPEPLDEGVQVYCDTIKVDLTALYRNEDPFGSSKEKGDEAINSFLASQGGGDVKQSSND